LIQQNKINKDDRNEKYDKSYPILNHRHAVKTLKALNIQKKKQKSN